MSKILSARETAKRLGCPASKVRARLRKGLWSFGTAFSPKETGLKTWTYEVYEDQLDDYLRGRNK